MSDIFYSAIGVNNFLANIMRGLQSIRSVSNIKVHVLTRTSREQKIVTLYHLSSTTIYVIVGIPMITMYAALDLTYLLFII